MLHPATIHFSRVNTPVWSNCDAENRPRIGRATKFADEIPGRVELLYFPPEQCPNVKTIRAQCQTAGPGDAPLPDEWWCRTGVRDSVHTQNNKKIDAPYC